jgi:hypothetical protein
MRVRSDRAQAISDDLAVSQTLLVFGGGAFSSAARLSAPPPSPPASSSAPLAVVAFLPQPVSSSPLPFFAPRSLHDLRAEFVHVTLSSTFHPPSSQPRTESESGHGKRAREKERQGEGRDRERKKAREIETAWRVKLEKEEEV